MPYFRRHPDTPNREPLQPPCICNTVVCVLKPGGFCSGQRPKFQPNTFFHSHPPGWTGRVLCVTKEHFFLAYVCGLLFGFLFCLLPARSPWAAPWGGTAVSGLASGSTAPCRQKKVSAAPFWSGHNEEIARYSLPCFSQWLLCRKTETLSPQQRRQRCATVSPVYQPDVRKW